MKKTFSPAIILVVSVVFLWSCATLPKGASAVDHFEKEKYLGKWYEIARFDFSFERNLNNTTAEYSIRPDGTIDVKNRGYNYVTKKWQEAKGRAKFRGSDTVAALKVSFFGPFYAAYNVIALDKDYQYALVAGGSLKYLWILSRTTTIPDEIRHNYLSIAQNLGYDVSKLIWVEHNQ
jgi:apolipoprotein D and lipocalin family protein